MYLIKKDQELTPTILANFLNQFQTIELPRYMKWKNYYDGMQSIMYKQATDTGKPCNKVVTNFCKYIVDTYEGYLAGIPIQYDNDEFEDIINILKYNDYIQEDNELLMNALIYGRAFEVNYIDEESNQRFRIFDTRGCIPVYDNTLNNNLLYVIRFWEEELDANNQPVYMVEVYGPSSVKRYKSSAGFMSFQFLEEVPHFYGQCPVTVFSLNSDERSIFEQVITLQDSYNEVLSGSVDDFDSFADAYLMLKGMDATDEELTDMKQNRVLMMDTDCDASYLTKQISDTQVLNLLNNFKNNIHKIANCPDLSDTNLSINSGIALRLKLVNFENAASNIEANMRKALQRRIELICAILNLTDEERTWRDIKITFTRNIPLETENIIAMVNSLRGLVSTRTLLEQIPFIDNVDEEMERLAAENALNAQLYGNDFEETVVEDFNINN